MTTLKCLECGKKLSGQRRKFCSDLHQRRWHGRIGAQERAKLHKEKGLCRNCSRPVVNGKAFCEICNSRKNKLMKKKRAECRKLVFEYYGNKCACCGEYRPEFLAVDHINGGGVQHRKKIGQNIHFWLVRNNFPKGFRILCHNCNQAIGYYGYCPHEVEKKCK